MHRQKVVAPSLIKISLLLHRLFMFFSKGFVCFVLFYFSISSKDKSLGRENGKALNFLKLIVKLHS